METAATSAKPVASASQTESGNHDGNGDEMLRNFVGLNEYSNEWLYTCVVMWLCISLSFSQRHNNSVKRLSSTYFRERERWRHFFVFSFGIAGTLA